MEKENFLGCLPHINWQASGAPVAPPVMNCTPSDQLQSCVIGLNRDLPVDQSAAAAALSLTVSSPSTHSTPTTAADSVAIRELIGRLGGIGDISPQSHQWSNALNSPPKHNLSMMERHHLQLQAQGNLVMPGSLLQAAALLGQFPAGDSGFAEMAARLSCIGGNPQTFGILQGQFAVPETGNPSRLMRNQSMNDGRSQMPVQENTNEIPMLSRCSPPEAREEPSASDHTMNTDRSGKKRKGTPRGKAREIAVWPVAEKPSKVGEEECQNAKRSKPTDAVRKAEIKQKSEDSGGENGGGGGEKVGEESNSKAPEPPKDYIHVRARRGQATDSHSLAERVRREKISERMKFLQNLVPGCNKVTGKAVMLDEIINYVQSLQRQVEFLSMKLATVNPRLDIDLENLLQKDIQQPRGSLPLPVYPMENSTPPFQFAPTMINGIESNCSVNPLDTTIRRTLGGQLPSLDGFSDTSSQAGPFWEDDLQNLVQLRINQNQEGRFSSEPFQGELPSTNMRIKL